MNNPKRYCPEDVSWYILEFTQLILHGSDEHKHWLKEAANKYIFTGEVPGVKG
jgi:hypothetical protein